MTQPSAGSSAMVSLMSAPDRNTQLAASRHGVPRIECQVCQDLTDLPGIGHDATQRGFERDGQLDVRSNQAFERRLGSRDDGVQVQRPRLRRLPPTDCYQLPDEAGGPLAGFANRLQIRVN